MSIKKRKRVRIGILVASTRKEVNKLLKNFVIEVRYRDTIYPSIVSSKLSSVRGYIE